MRSPALHWLSRVIGRRKVEIAGLLLLEVVLGLTGVFFALQLRIVVDAAAGDDRRAFGLGLLGAAGVAAAQVLLRGISQYTGERTRSSIENVCKSRLFGTLLHKDYASVTAVHTGEWMNRLTSDTAVCASGAVEILPGAAGMLVRLVSALVLMLYLEPEFALIIVPGGILLPLLSWIFRKTLKRLHKRMQEADGRTRIFLQEHLESLLVIRSFSAEERALREGEARMEEHRKTRMARAGFSTLCNTGFAAAMNGMYLLGLGCCGYGILQGRYTYGTLMAMLQLIGQLQSPLAGISGYLPRFYAMTASAERLMEAETFTEDLSGESRDKAEIETFYHEKFAAVELEKVSFSYPGEARSEILHEVTFSLEKGSFTAVTGYSGCGKSTLLRLMMCLYPVESGQRRLRCRDGGRVDLTPAWHGLFAYVPQGNYLMSGTLREAVTLSEECPDEARLRRALETACADFAWELGLESRLGERGQGLSEGQMQRIAIARGLYAGAPILLLDESTSALDAATEKKLLENLRHLTDKTVVIVTHRPAALEVCDTIIHMDEHGVEVRYAAT